MASHCLIIMTQAIEVYRRHPFKDIVMEIYYAIFFSTIRILLHLCSIAMFGLMEHEYRNCTKLI